MNFGENGNYRICCAHQRLVIAKKKTSLNPRMSLINIRALSILMLIEWFNTSTSWTEVATLETIEKIYVIMLTNRRLKEFEIVEAVGIGHSSVGSILYDQWARESYQQDGCNVVYLQSVWKNIRCVCEAITLWRKVFWDARVIILIDYF